MSHRYLHKMLDMLTGAYNRTDVQNANLGLPPETNIGKLFETFAWSLELVHYQSDKVLLWDNIDYATGAVLDRYGANFGVSRNGASDDFYRLLIKVKMISLLSGGDIDTVINAAASLLSVNVSDILLEEVFPAKIFLYLDSSKLDSASLANIDLVLKMVKRIVAAGVGIKFILVKNRNYQNTLYINTGAAVKTSSRIRPPEINRNIPGKIFSAGGYSTISYIRIRPKKQGEG